MARHREIGVSLLLALTVMLAGSSVAQQTSAVSDPRDNSGVLRRKDRVPMSNPRGTIGQRGPQFFVLNGNPAPEYRYVVGISFVTPTGPGICTGTLVGKRLVLTAAHCGCGDSYKVTQSQQMAGGKELAVEGAPNRLDPQICRSGVILPGYDLALLRLAEDASIDDAYEAFPRFAYSMIDAMRPTTELTVVGYGLTQLLGLGVRMEASVPVFTPDCAQRKFVEAGCAPFFEMILAPERGTGTRPTDTCSGDSGGPVFAAVRGRSGMMEPSLVAVTSRPAPLPQIDLFNHCGGGGIYTVVGRRDVRNWLLQNGVIAGAQ